MMWRFWCGPRAALLVITDLNVLSSHGDFSQAVQAITAVAANAHYDLVIVSCKAYDLDSAIVSMAPAVGAGTLVLPLLNGLRQLDALDAAFGIANVLGGVCHISVTLDADGAVRQFGSLDRLTFGDPTPQSPCRPAS
jgi:2-dehydropantoate 2-reductase